MAERVTIRADRTANVTYGIAVATRNALKRGIISARAELSTRLNKEIGVRVKVIKTHLDLTQPTIENLVATLRISGRPVPAIEYRAKQTPKGVTFTAGSSRAFLKGAFLATMKTGHRGVYSRSRPSRSRKGKPRSSPALPIFERFGPPLSVVALRSGEMLPAVLAVGQESFRKNLAHELQRRLGSRKATA
jgi:hypothetical protein